MASPPRRSGQPPRSTSDQSTTRHVPSRGTSNHVDPAVAANSITSVKQMQQAIKNFSNAVASSIGWSNLKEDQSNMQETSKTLHRDSFNDFIAQNYAGVVNESGMEFDPDPSKQTLEQKTPTALNKMNTILDTISRIGSPKSEFIVDGDWGFRTSNALKNVYAVAAGVLSLAKDLGIQLTGYSDSHLNELKNLLTQIPKDTKHMQNKGALATAITPHIVELTNLYAQLKQKIFDKPSLKSYIEGTQAFSTIKSNKPKLENDEDVIYNDLKKNKLNSTYATPSVFDIMLNGKQYFLNLSDLIDEDSFTAWKKKSKLDNVSDLQILDLVKKALTTKNFGPLDKNKGWNTFNPEASK